MILMNVKMTRRMIRIMVIKVQGKGIIINTIIIMCIIIHNSILISTMHLSEIIIIIKIHFQGLEFNLSMKIIVNIKIQPSKTGKMISHITILIILHTKTKKIIEVRRSQAKIKITNSKGIKKILNNLSNKVNMKIRINQIWINNKIIKTQIVRK